MLSEGVTMTKMTKEWQFNAAINAYARGKLVRNLEECDKCYC
jgi:SH3-like domain-containing protein